MKGSSKMKRLWKIIIINKNKNKNKSKAVAKITDTVSYIYDCAKVKPSTLGSALGKTGEAYFLSNSQLHLKAAYG